MLEDNCYCLDITIASKMCHSSNDDAGTDRTKSFLQSYEYAKSLEHSIADLKEKIQLVRDAIEVNILKEPENTENIRAIFTERSKNLQQKLERQVQYCLGIFKIRFHKELYFMWIK